ncbi:coronin-7-like isoform X2 [Ptiloglossa arizonensis]|uniref:coronin-7-like isoform X2 n=1 Tax=Ptiloglossa arizonensis TaxID=3350558 RepID=UPI003FA0F8C3
MKINVMLMTGIGYALILNRGECPKKKKLGQEIGKAAAEKSRGLFGADDWKCSNCGTVIWACIYCRHCYMCNTSEVGEFGKCIERPIFMLCQKMMDPHLEEEERGNANRNSIVERRRLYESRSESVTDENLAEKAMGSPIMLRRRAIPMIRQQSMDSHLEKIDSVTPTAKRTSTVFGRVSKFRHLKSTPGHKSTHIEIIWDIKLPRYEECDGFHANPLCVAVPLSGPDGKIAVVGLKKTGRIRGLMPTVVNDSAVMDFQWNPFDNQQLAVACADGMIRLWVVRESGLSEPINQPKHTINAHTDKIYLIKFHPLASDILASASYDMTVKIWDLTPLRSGEAAVAKITLTGHTDQIFSLAWSPCGQYLASACKDRKLRIYKPRCSDVPVKSGKGPAGTRGARVVWALKGQFLVVMGFDKEYERQIYVFKTDNLNNPLTTVGLDVSPAILIPYYDEDSSTLFLTGRGDSTIYAFEVTEEAPYCCPLSHHRCSSFHHGLSFLPKNKCDVASVEFASALRLTDHGIEPLSFTVPRIKSGLFQDDLFPPTKVTWKPTMTATEWFYGANKQAHRISLKPPGMYNLTENQGQEVVTVPIVAKQSFSRFGWNPDVKAKQEKIQKIMSYFVGDVIKCSLEQDHMEGVEEHEWDE